MIMPNSRRLVFSKSALELASFFEDVARQFLFVGKIGR